MSFFSPFLNISSSERRYSHIIELTRLIIQQAILCSRGVHHVLLVSILILKDFIMQHVTITLLLKPTELFSYRLISIRDFLFPIFIKMLLVATTNSN